MKPQIGFAIACGVFLALLMSSRVATALTIYQPFSLPEATDTWQSYALPLSPGSWLVAPTRAEIGEPNGATASVAEIQGILSNVRSLEIGGVCTGSVVGAVEYPCGFRFDSPNFASFASDGFAVSPNGWTGAANGSATGLSWSSDLGNPDGNILIQPGSDRTLVTFVAPPAYLGTKSSAYGMNLSFDLLALSNSSTPPDSPISFSYGVAIISSEAVPEPSTVAAMIAGLALLGWQRVRGRRP